MENLIKKVDIESLLQKLIAAEIQEFEVSEGDYRLKLKFASEGTVVPKIQVSQNREIVKESSEELSGSKITSPLAGVFYSSPTPGSKSFVKEGMRVSKGDVLCIIEAMKMMNEIESDRDGTIKRILPENGEAVEVGQTLFILGD